MMLTVLSLCVMESARGFCGFQAATSDSVSKIRKTDTRNFVNLHRGESSKVSKDCAPDCECEKCIPPSEKPNDVAERECPHCMPASECPHCAPANTKTRFGKSAPSEHSPDCECSDCVPASRKSAPLKHSPDCECSDCVSANRKLEPLKHSPDCECSDCVPANRKSEPSKHSPDCECSDCLSAGKKTSSKDTRTGGKAAPTKKSAPHTCRSRAKGKSCSGKSCAECTCVNCNCPHRPRAKRADPKAKEKATAMRTSQDFCSMTPSFRERTMGAISKTLSQIASIFQGKILSKPSQRFEYENSGHCRNCAK
ncbi:RP2-alkaline phosphatase hybrid protein [Perkinsela sp. CCAP 1560/4]|nr:RP2-alkaline phosphatase hybrid protein [Perkinsela sp. CCAP 1560/4]|eukprot:KNH03666.1 RP2-alkaline phosphatase hybrid protein [Perkinsela sp. CCAP 1560/4]